MSHCMSSMGDRANEFVGKGVSDSEKDHYGPTTTPGSKIRVANDCQNPNFSSSLYWINYTFIMCLNVWISSNKTIFYKKNEFLVFLRHFFNFGQFVVRNSTFWAYNCFYKHVYHNNINHRNNNWHILLLKSSPHNP